MSYIDQLRDINRDAPRSITQQIVDAISRAIDAGELRPGDRLPPTRELAELVGVNHLTAVRAYRRLRELGRVSARVGSGTYVRDPRARAVTTAPDSEHASDWQEVVLPAMDRSEQDRAVFAMSRQQVSGDVVPLSVGYPPTHLLPTDAWARHTARALERLGPEALQYGPVEGDAAFREQIAVKSGDDSTADEVLVVNGAMQGLTLVARTTLRPGDVVACESPTYIGAITALQSAGADLRPLRTDEHGLDVDDLEDLAAREEIKAVLVQSRLSNPTGADLSAERCARLVALARRHGFFVIDDEVWASLRFEGEDPGPLRARAPGHVIAISSLSKWAGGGLRLGWIRASGPVLEALALAKHRDDLLTPTVTQHAAASWLASDEYLAHLAVMRDAHRAGRDALLEALDRHLGELATWTRPRGGACLLVTLNRPVDERELLAETARAGVSIVPGAAMTLGPRPETAFRLTYGYARPEDMDLGVRRLAQAIRAAGRGGRAPVGLPVT